MNNNNGEKMNYSPENKKINYYEQNPKLFKKQRQRPSLIKNSQMKKEDINNELNFNENMIINNGILDMQNYNCVSQPINPRNLENNKSQNYNILDDFLDELENEENRNNNIINNEEPMGSELKRNFARNKYTTYFQVSRTQSPQFSNIWEDFHQKRDKLY